MASIKVKFRESTVEGKEGTIYYQVIHERTVRQITTIYHLKKSEWDSRRSCPAATFDPNRAPALRQISESIRSDCKRFVRIINDFDRKCLVYSADEIIEEFLRLSRRYSLFSFMQSIIYKLEDYGKIRTSEAYRSTFNSFKKYRNGQDIMIDCVTSEIIEGYEAYLRKSGLTQNTTSFYMRVLRAVYNRAVEQGAVEQTHPFRHVYTGIDKTVKRALSINTIRTIKRLDLTHLPMLDYARDMFMLSFALRGMSFIDMAFLRKTDLKTGQLIYRRRKTGQQLSIKWTDEMQTILDKYPENQSKYLLPIIIKPSKYERKVYRNMGHRINTALKKIAEMANINVPLTLYVARHSWASVAKTKGIPISIISEGMGHDSESTTQIYLASLDSSAIDSANSLILQSI